jgi:hypothetical protein
MKYQVILIYGKSEQHKEVKMEFTSKKDANKWIKNNPSQWGYYEVRTK